MSEEPHRDDRAMLAEYARLARAYDTRWSSYLGLTAGRTIARLEPRAGQRILDVGCGSGLLLAALAAEAPRLNLTGIDPSPEMLAIARERVGRLADLREAWAGRLPFADAGFDAVVSTSVFHYVRDPGRALAEMRRVLVPGGRVVLTDWCGDYLSCRLCALYLRFRRRPFARIYKSAQLGRMLEAARFAGVRVERYRLDRFWGLMTANATRPFT